MSQLNAVARDLFSDPPAESATNAITLLRLTIHNWKGIKEFTLDAGGANISVYGDNATGKTTLFDAYSWLLRGKDSQNRKDFEIKPLDAQGEAAHGLEHEVEGTFAWQARTFTLKRVFAEKWTKQRGSAEKTFTGHETTYYVDGVPKTQREYELFVASICEEKVFGLLSDPAYFNEQLHWQDRRRLLLQVCGNISDDEVIASDDRLADLADILDGRSLDDHRKVIAAQRSKINKDLEQIPVRISEVERGLPDTSRLDQEEIEKRLATLRSERREKADELARAENGAALADLQVRRSRVSAAMSEIERRCREKAEAATYQLREKLQEARHKAEDWGRYIENQHAIVETKTAEAERLRLEIEKLYMQYDEAEATEFTYSADTVCPTCGQDLPKDQIEAARQRALEAFNIAKSGQLEVIREEGKTVRARMEAAQAVAEKAVADIAKAEKTLADAQKLISKLETEVAKARGASAASDPIDDPEYLKLVAERGSLDAEIGKVRAGGEGETAGIKAEIAALDEAIGKAERSVALIFQRETAEKRIAELKAEEHNLAAEYERLEKELYLTDEFVRAKVRLLEDRINSRFKYARFKLFDLQVNGGLEECCETLYGGVPYGSNLNRGARLNVGLDVLNTLSEHFSMAVPVWIDNREAVTHLIAVNSQVISLIVSAPDKTLRIVKEVS